MKLDLEPVMKNSQTPSNGVPETPPPGSSRPATRMRLRKGFRRLKDNEMVRHGDFVADEQKGFEPWEGPGGFLASAFLKPIYRHDGSRQTATHA